MARFECYIPTKAAITQIFGVNGDWYKQHGFAINGHDGIDYGCATGTPIYATHNGVVTYAAMDGTGSNTIVLQTNEAYDYKDGKAFFHTIYCHLKTFMVDKGQAVKAGQLIGYSNNTGVSTGPHLHFGMKPVQYNTAQHVWYNVDQANGYAGAIDPAPYYNGLYAEDVWRYGSILDKMKQVLTIIKNWVTGLQ